jgi:hypothetical protein
MRNKKKSLLASGYAIDQIKLEWNKKIISTKDAVFKVQNGNLVNLPLQSTVTFQPRYNTTADQIQTTNLNTNLGAGGTHQSGSQARSGELQFYSKNYNYNNNNHYINNHRSRGRGNGTARGPQYERRKINGFSQQHTYSSSPNVNSQVPVNTRRANFLC